MKGVKANYLIFYTGLAIIVAMAANMYVGRVRGTGAGVVADDAVLRVETHRQALRPVDGAARHQPAPCKKGEVLGLLGDNGAGKSTLIKIICGFQKQDGGSMLLRGEPYEPNSVDDARSLGIDTVYQDLALIDELSVFHNLFLRRERVLKPLPLLANRADEARGARGARRDRHQHPAASTSPSRASRAASARRSRSRARSTRTPTSSCSTSRSRRWAPKRARRSSTSSRA